MCIRDSSLPDVFHNCQDMFLSSSPTFFSLLEENIDISDFIPCLLYTSDTGRQPGHLRKNGNKKRQISVRENWRAKNSHYYTELHGTIMPMQCYTCQEEQCFFLLM